MYIVPALRRFGSICFFHLFTFTLVSLWLSYITLYVCMCVCVYACVLSVAVAVTVTVTVRVVESWGHWRCKSSRRWPRHVPQRTGRYGKAGINPTGVSLRPGASAPRHFGGIILWSLTRVLCDRSSLLTNERYPCIFHHDILKSDALLQGDKWVVWESCVPSFDCCQQNQDS